MFYIIIYSCRYFTRKQAEFSDEWDLLCFNVDSHSNVGQTVGRPGKKKRILLVRVSDAPMDFSLSSPEV